MTGVLDSVDPVIAFGLKGMNPIQVLQYVASGLFGRQFIPGRTRNRSARRRPAFFHCLRRRVGLLRGQPQASRALPASSNVGIAIRRCRLSFHELFCAFALRRSEEPVLSSSLPERHLRPRHFCGLYDCPVCAPLSKTKVKAKSSTGERKRCRLSPSKCLQAN